MACCHFQNYPGSWAIIRPVSELSIIRRSGRLRLTHIGIEGQLATRRRGINDFVQTLQADAFVLEPAAPRNQILDGPPQPISRQTTRVSPARRSSLIWASPGRSATAPRRASMRPAEGPGSAHGWRPGRSRCTWRSSHRVKKPVRHQIYLDVLFLTVFITQTQRQTLPKTRRRAGGNKTSLFLSHAAGDYWEPLITSNRALTL